MGKTVKYQVGLIMTLICWSKMYKSKIKSVSGQIHNNRINTGLLVCFFNPSSSRILRNQSICEGITLQWSRIIHPKEDKHHQLETELFQKHT